MKRLTKWYVRSAQFCKRTLWEPRPFTAKNPVGWFLPAIVRRIVLTVRAFLREGMPYRASALTYTTLLSVVPLLSVVVAIAKGFGLDTLVEQEMRKALAGQPAVAETLIGFVNSYLSHTRGGVFLGFGLLLLLWTLLSLTGNIEATFNEIWQVKRERSTFRKVTDYTAVFFLLPVLLVVSAGLSIFVTSFIETLPDVLLLRPALMSALKLLPYAVTCLLLTAFYAFMPNTRVRFKSALVAAIPAGIAFQALQLFYIHSQMWLSSYNAIYGSFAALPLFMLWCQVSWYICLFGATLSYVDQHIDHFHRGRSYTRVSRRCHDFLSLVLAADICRRFTRRRSPRTAAALAAEYSLPLRLVNDLLYEQCRAGILAEAGGDEKNDATVFLPAYDVRLLTPATLLETLGNAGNELAKQDMKRFDPHWPRFEERYRQMLAREFAEKPLADLFSEETETPATDQKNK